MDDEPDFEPNGDQYNMQSRKKKTVLPLIENLRRAVASVEPLFLRKDSLHC